MEPSPAAHAATYWSSVKSPKDGSPAHPTSGTHCCRSPLAHTPLPAAERTPINMAAPIINYRAMATTINTIHAATALTITTTAMRTTMITATIIVATHALLCQINVTNIAIDSPLIWYMSNDKVIPGTLIT
uniref:Uncharacterized protein n=1 Tax=Romanomermis culicivorax TaxID=13658 RepID=A0A915HNA0_ROMCU